MDPTQLPEELQFELLLDRPYHEIITYCQVNTAASHICQSVLFWNLKLNRLKDEDDFGGDPTEEIVPPNLNYVRGADSATKYAFMEDLIQRGLDILPMAVRYGQVDLIKYWLQYGVFNIEDLEFIGDRDIVIAAREGQLEVIALISELLSDSNRRSIFRKAINLALKWDEPLSIILYLNQFADYDYPELLVQMILFDRTIDIEKIIPLAEEDLLQKFMERLQDNTQISEEQYLDMVGFLLNKYPEKIDAWPLFLKELKQCERAQLFADHLNLF